MIVVDPDKVAKMRDVIDPDVAYISAMENVSRPRAYVLLAQREFRALLLMHFDLRTAWWTCTAFPGALDLKPRSVEQMASDPMPTEELAREILRHTVVGRNPEVVALASILHLLDEDVNLSLESEDVTAHYGRQAWLEIARSVGKDDLLAIDPDQMLLFGSEAEQKVVAEISKVHATMERLVLCRSGAIASES